NGRYIRETLTTEQLLGRLVQWAGQPEYVLPILKLVHERVDKLSDVLPKVAHFFSEPQALTEVSFAHKKLQPQDCIKVLFFVSRRFDGLRTWNAERLRAELEQIGEGMGLKIRDLLFP